MIILPDRNIPRAKYLLPMARKVWQRLPTHVLGQTWIAQLFHADHSMVWQGHFEDREDADEFMAAMYAGTLKADGYLQRLPIYCPDFDPHLLDDPSISYNMASNIGIGPGSGNWGAPGDCVGIRGLAGEFIDCIGAGGGAACGVFGWQATGGGGGGFARIYNRAMTPGGVYPYAVGSGGAGASSTGTGAHGAGGTAHTYFWDPSVVQATVGAGGQAGGNGTPGGAGGSYTTAAAAYVGGRGGQVPDGQISPTGGGAAAGPSGNGNWGGDYPSQAGGAGQGLVYGPWGPGGGGNAALGPNGVAGGAGGFYGGGGGGGMNNQSTSFSQSGGAGAGGLIVIRYESVTQHTVTSISPTSGPTTGGQAVTVTGTNFDGSLNAGANIGGATITGVGIPSSTQLTGTSSAGGAGVYQVNVYKTGASVASGGTYRYVTPPTLTGISPNVGPTTGGQAVTVFGTGFTGAGLSNISGANIGGLWGLSSISVTSDSTFTAVTSSTGGTTGLYSVQIANVYGFVETFNLYTYGLLATVSSCSPDIGLIFGNTLVTITGANFTGTTAVRFGGSNATSITVVNPTTITCRTPAHAKGLVSVDVTNTYGLGTGSSVFTYLLPASGFNMPMMGI